MNLRHPISTCGTLVNNVLKITVAVTKQFLLNLTFLYAKEFSLNASDSFFSVQPHLK